MPWKPFREPSKARAETGSPGKTEQNGAPAEPKGFVGRGRARERSEEYPQGCSEWSGLCEDEGGRDSGSL